MKLLKIKHKLEIEILIPADELSQKDIDELHSEEGQKTFNQNSLKEAQEQAKLFGGKIISLEVKAEVIEV